MHLIYYAFAMRFVDEWRRGNNNNTAWNTKCVASSDSVQISFKILPTKYHSFNALDTQNVEKLWFFHYSTRSQHLLFVPVQMRRNRCLFSKNGMCYSGFLPPDHCNKVFPLCTRKREKKMKDRAFRFWREYSYITRIAPTNSSKRKNSYTWHWNDEFFLSLSLSFFFTLSPSHFLSLSSLLFLSRSKLILVWCFELLNTKQAVSESEIQRH